MRLTLEEARELARMALDDEERTGAPLVDRVAAAVRAGAELAVDAAAETGLCALCRLCVLRRDGTCYVCDGPKRSD